ncbi:MAG: hypothetical protein JNM56_10190 [Planctomycetia bacterium]|nr:hypothetical protein [Planctomycetia bacterium]
MATEKFANNAQTTLVGDINNSVTSITVASGSGFPASEQFRIRIDNELMLVTTGGSGSTTWTVTRGVEGTTATSHCGGALVTHGLTAGAIQNLDASVITTGVLPIAKGGTNSTAALNNNRLMGSSGGAIVERGAMTNGQLPIGSTGAAPVNAALTAGSGITIINGAGSIEISASGGGGSGTVTSVDMTVPSVLAVSGNPVTTSGTLALSYSGTALPVANGGTNSTTALNNNRLMGSSGGAIVERAAMTNGQLAIGSTGAAPVSATLSPENGVYTVNGAGSIRIGNGFLGGPLSHAVNGGFDAAQRQTPGTPTTISDGSIGPDHWIVRRENADLRYQRNTGVSETTLTSRYYGRFEKITNAGKIMILQIIPHRVSVSFRTYYCQFQFTARGDISRTLKAALLEWRGTADSVDTSISSWNGTGTDPTFTSFTSLLYPASISNSCTTAWSRFNYGSGTHTTSCNNSVIAIWSDAGIAANGTIDIGEVTLSINQSGFTTAWQPLPMYAMIDQVRQYCRKSFAFDTEPIQNAGTDTGEYTWPSPVTGSSTVRSPRIVFPTPMHGTPTVTLYNPSAANAEVRNITGVADCSSSSAVSITSEGFAIETTTTAGTAAGDLLGVHWLAVSEL